TAGGIIDVEGVLEVPAAKLVDIVGDRATAARLQAMAKQVLAGAPPPPAPAPTGGGTGGTGGTGGAVGGIVGRPPAAAPAKRSAPKPPRKKG
ncbi:MAG TPA: hypothetical protein PLO07_07435, partial [Rubrivivax sp.]|nr:hypothetical protein [Rubrivivax sp.]